jgi:hypothetical protein
MKHQIEIPTPRLILKSMTPASIHHLFEERSEDELKSYFNMDCNGYNH